MNSKSITRLAITAAVLVVGILFLNVVEENGSSSSGDLLLPQLTERANDLRKIVISGTDENGPTTLVREDERWVVAERGNFPADADKLRELVLALADAEAVEEKTSLPERYALLGVDDGPGSSGRTITMSGDGFELGVILGNEAQSKYRYARVVGESQSWLINANPDIPESTGDWLSSAVIDIDGPAVRAVTIEHADGELIAISKSSEEDTDFQVSDVPEGRELSYASVANGIGRVLNDLELDDVISKDELTDEPVATTTFELFDGGSVVVETFDIDDEKWHAITELADGEATPAAQSQWLYKLPDFKRNLLIRRWEDILKTEE